MSCSVLRLLNLCAFFICLPSILSSIYSSIAASNPVDFLRLVANMSGTISLNTIPRNLIEESNKCKCVGNFGDIDWTFRCNDQVFCLSFFVRRISSVTGITTTSVNQTFKHYRGVTKAYTSSDFENGKWIRITQDVNGKCDQVSVSLFFSSLFICFISYERDMNYLKFF